MTTLRENSRFELIEYEDGSVGLFDKLLSQLGRFRVWSQWFDQELEYALSCTDRQFDGWCERNA